jgi:hypothetical protein
MGSQNQTPEETLASPIALWAKNISKAPKSPSLKEIQKCQKAEARRATQGKETIASRRVQKSAVNCKLGTRGLQTASSKRMNWWKANTTARYPRSSDGKTNLFDRAHAKTAKTSPSRHEVLVSDLYHQLLTWLIKLKGKSDLDRYTWCPAHHVLNLITKATILIRHLGPDNRAEADEVDDSLRDGGSFLIAAETVLGKFRVHAIWIQRYSQKRQK